MTPSRVIAIYGATQDGQYRVMHRLQALALEFEWVKPGSKNYLKGRVVIGDTEIADGVTELINNGSSAWVCWGGNFVPIRKVNKNNVKGQRVLICDQSFLSTARCKVGDAFYSFPFVRLVEPSPPQPISEWLEQERERAALEHLKAVENQPAGEGKTIYLDAAKRYGAGC